MGYLEQFFRKVYKPLAKKGLQLVMVQVWISFSRDRKRRKVKSPQISNGGCAPTLNCKQFKLLFIIM